MPAIDMGYPKDVVIKMFKNRFSTNAVNCGTEKVKIILLEDIPEFSFLDVILTRLNS